MRYQIRSFKIADQAGPQKKPEKRTKKDATKNPGTPEKPSRSQKTVSETPEELLTARKTRFCAISPKNASEERKIFSKVAQKPLKLDTNLECDKF